MNGNKQLRREFYRNPASYCRVMNVESAVTFGLFEVDSGGTVGMLSVRWEKLGNELAPQLHAYYDSWRVLASFADVLARMADMTGPSCSPDAFCQLLVDCGFIKRALRGVDDHAEPTLSR
jgi:hypothetical protein